MRKIFMGLFLLTSYVVSGQVINKIPQYGFQNRLSVGRDSDNDTIAYFQVGPNTGGNKGIIFPRVANVSALIGTPKKGLIIYDDSKDSLGYYNGAQWVYMGGSIGGGLDTTIFTPGATQIVTTSSYTIADSVSTVIIDAASDVDVYLPDPEDYDKREITIKNPSENQALFTVPIYYSSTVTSTSLAAGKWIHLKSDAGLWWVTQESGVTSSTTVTGGSGGLSGNLD